MDYLSATAGAATDPLVAGWMLLLAWAGRRWWISLIGAAAIAAAAGGLAAAEAQGNALATQGFGYADAWQTFLGAVVAGAAWLALFEGLKRLNRPRT